MSRWETFNNILKVVIPAFLTLISAEVALIYYDFIEISPSIMSWELTFGCILLSVSINFYSYYSSRKLTEFLMIESIKRRPFKELYTFGQIAIWNDISSNIFQEGKKCVPFGVGFSRSAAFLDKMFKKNMADIRRKLNTKYKDIDEDEIHGNDAILIAAKKTSDEDVKQYYNENIFSKNDNWKKYGTPGPLDPITTTTKFEKNEKLRGRIQLATTLFFIAYMIFYFWLAL
ncbi:DEHA2G00352p [Debaryomyces hansenii CBS767]|uniref:DEHA2G00352p n=1 Tax=Debaryomyces hansenii (strain ATCC 36239 / CBS 767 / BCRC 21394 / JCM 1990 / NBRC 0083 / IGC 2968) TaxID=284592 RepID=Q6BJS3_DEBHA|nr:DEHA2G00352p [Debaryomyces hansenii CBS767]CAG89992.2 DEHA2G00352p [Debaryomyces hansenii CBS767]|eukprot:XP_461548.2 DEHA2G00352p [Debaryomyces hansenii CBS767]